MLLSSSEMVLEAFATISSIKYCERVALKPSRAGDEVFHETLPLMAAGIMNTQHTDTQKRLALQHSIADRKATCKALPVELLTANG